MGFRPLDPPETGHGRAPSLSRGEAVAVARLSRSVSRLGAMAAHQPVHRRPPGRVAGPWMGMLDRSMAGLGALLDLSEIGLRLLEIGG